MDNPSNTVLTRSTVVSKNFLALHETEGYGFAPHPYGRRGMISLAQAIRETTRSHPYLTRCGKLWAADLAEASAILSTLELALGT